MEKDHLIIMKIQIKYVRGKSTLLHSKIAKSNMDFIRDNLDRHNWNKFRKINSGDSVLHDESRLPKLLSVMLLL